MPSWIPGEDHLINFQKGDLYVKLDEGYARLPGGGSIYMTRSLSPADPKTSLARARCLRPANTKLPSRAPPATQPLPLVARSQPCPGTASL